MAYNEFAYFYDEFNGEADYDALYAHIRAELQAHGIQDGILADLGCGTGELTLMLTQAGYDMIGIDQSEEMLCVVRDKAEQLGLSQEATLEEILAAIATLQEATAEAQEAEAEAILNSEGAEDMTPEEKEIMKEQIITNRERAIKVLKNRAAARGKANQQGKPANAAVFARPIMNRSGMNNRADKTRKALSIRDRAHEIQQRTGMGYFEALTQAQREFGEA